MKFLFLLPLIALAGCRTLAPASLLPLPPNSDAAEMAPPRAAPDENRPLPADPRLRQQAQCIEALLGQIDALKDQLAATTQGPPPLPPPPAPVAVATPTPAPALAAVPVVIPLATVPPAPVPAAPPPTPAAAPPSIQVMLVALRPNAEGVVDVASLSAPAADSDNPFAVRIPPPHREVSLRIGGVILGQPACVVINDRIVEKGEVFDSLKIDQIDADGVLFVHPASRVYLPVSEKAVRVRLPL